MAATPCLVKIGMTHPDGKCECFFGGSAPIFEQKDNHEQLQVPRQPSKNKGPKGKKRGISKFNIRIR